MTPSAWALERAEAYLASRDGRPLGDRAGIARALDAARLTGVRAGMEAAARLADACPAARAGCRACQTAADCFYSPTRRLAMTNNEYASRRKAIEEFSGNAALMLFLVASASALGVGLVAAGALPDDSGALTTAGIGILAGLATWVSVQSGAGYFVVFATRKALAALDKERDNAS